MLVEFTAWPSLPELFPTSFPGIQTGRDSLVVDIDYARLVQRMSDYFDPAISNIKLARRMPAAFENTARFQGEAVRRQLLHRGFLPDNILRYCYRPFDMRWLYWEPEANLLDQNRPDYVRQPFKNNLWLEMRRKQRPAPFDRGYVVHTPADGFGKGVSRFFPLYLSLENKQYSYFETDGAARHPNLSVKAMVYAKGLEVTAPNLFYHLVAVLHSPAYRAEQAEALQQDWPRLPLPQSRAALRQSATLGQKIVMLLNPEIKVPQVTTGPIRPDLAMLGQLRHVEAEPEGRSPKPDLALTAGWGQPGRNGNPGLGPGLIDERVYTAEERAAIEKGGASSGISFDQLDGYWGQNTYDIYLNETTYWANIPAPVWEYTAGGYPVLKKWLSYRENQILGRPLKPDEAEEIVHIARRIAALRLMTPTLNANYQAIKQAVYHWLD
jgi:hypothetical protein